MEFEKVERQHVLQGIEDFKNKGIPPEFGKSSTYDLVYLNTEYPPKAVMAYANFHAEGRKVERYFKGGLDTDCFKRYKKLGFDVIEKKSLPQLDLIKLNPFIRQYAVAVSEDLWLEKHEIYKFNFAKWIEKKLDVKNQSPTEIKDIIDLSQTVLFEKDSTTKGINFIQSIKRYNDDYITTEDIEHLKNIALDATDSVRNVSFSFNSYPKTSIFLSFFDPVHYTPYDLESWKIYDEIKKDSNKAPKQGVAAFVFYQMLYASVKNWLKKSSYFNIEIFKRKLEVEEISEKLWAWITQDFIYYVNKQIDNTMPENVKREFAQFLLDNAPNSYNQYLGISVQTIEERLNEINAFFTEEDLFEIEDNDPSIIISFIKKATGRKNRNERPEFVAYDKFHSNGIPKAIIGKNHYFKFLTAKYDNNDEAVFIEILKTLTREDVIKYFDFLDIIKTRLNLSINDNRFVTGISKQRLNLTVGQRYCWNLYSKRRKGKFGVISAEKIDETTEYYEGGKNDAFYTYSSDQKLAFDNKESVIKAISNEMARTTKSSFDRYNNNAFEKAMFNLDYRDEVFEKAFGSNNYFLVGAYWNGDENPDKTNNFVSEEIWQNGYEDKFKEIVNEVVTGDQIAIKAVYTRDKKDSVMLIKARGTVLSNSQDGKNLKVEWDKTFDPFEVNFSGGYWATIKQVTNKEHIQAIWGTDMGTDLKTTVNKKTPINQILYGPPGTGKTYELQNEYFSKYTISETNLTREQYIENVFNDLSWFQVITLIVLELETASVTQIIEHPLFKIKTKSSSSKNLRATVWGNLQAHTVEDCENVKYTRRVNPLIFSKDEDGNWTIVPNELEELFPEAEQMLLDLNDFQPSPSKLIKNYEFVTFHQSFSYEDFVEGIKPKMEEGETDLGYTIEDGVFKRLCKRAKTDPDNYYAIFIDEINRGNISAIFGELITLIEKDKRAGAKNALEAQLPYSKEKFSVPINLHIYGTMNTADRSVEALDTALRRRFEFKEMMPDYDVIKDEVVEDIALSKLLQTINERIELLIDRDHTIGHSYFVGVDTKEKLANAFNNKIVPLLQEYFYGDYGKIGLVLGKGFVEKIKNDTIDFASFDYENANDYRTSSYILKQVQKDTILDVVTELLGVKETVSE